jgi:tetratricopeptide (TPR) repeat protein
MGRFEECMPKYLDALAMEMDNRSRFVILVNLGTVYLTLGNIDKLVKKRRRAEAIGAWIDALEFDEGGADRSKVALDTGNLCLEDGCYAKAAAMYRKCIEYDDPLTGLSKKAHENLGSTNRLIGNLKHTLRVSTRSSSNLTARSAGTSNRSAASGSMREKSFRSALDSPLAAS